MPLKIREQLYPVPGEDDVKRLTGSELDVIETHFDVDGLALMRVLAAPNAKRVTGISRNRAMFSLAWVVLHRADASVSLQSVMDEYAVDEFEVVDGDKPAPKGRKAVAVPESVT